MKHIISFALLLTCGIASGQLYVEKGASFFIDDGSSVEVQGDVTSYHGISGNGWLIMDGEQTQTINLNGKSINNLEVKNRQGIELGANISILRSLKLSGGNLELGSYNLEMSDVTTTVNTGTFGIESHERGVVRVRVHNDLTNFFIPFVSRGIYTPLAVSSKGRYHNAYFEISSGTFRGSLPKDFSNYVDHAWKIKRNGIDGLVEAGIDVSRFVTAFASGTPMSLYSRNENEFNIIEGGTEIRGFRKGVVGLTGSEFVLMNRKANDLSFSLSPNPANDFTRVSLITPFDGRAVLTITDSRGNIVRAQPLQVFRGINFFQLDVANLANGTYDEILSQKGRIATMKFIKD